MILKKHCDYCRQASDVLSVEEYPDKKVIILSCLHSNTVTYVRASDIYLKSKANEELFPFQKEGIAFVVNSGSRALINDEMGLGKTVQALGVVSYSNNYPCLIVVKAGLRVQWLRQIMNWTGNVAHIISSEGEPNLGFKFCIASIDLLPRFKDKEVWVRKFGFKYLILDECQSIKNHDSKRTNALRAIAKEIPYFISLSGTPIKNNALEYFPVLNIAHPEKFSTLSGFQRDWCDTYYSGWTMKVGGIKDPKRFKDFTKDFIIRRSRSDVLPELPKVFRTTQFEELGKEVEAEYKQYLEEFQDYYNSSGTKSAFERQQNILAYMVKMRHLTGKSKIQGVVDYVEEFLMETDKKIVIFLHHKDVNAILVEKLNKIISGWPSELGEAVITLQSENNAYERNSIIEKFKTSRSRVMICSTLAAGEGVDGLQDICSDIIIMERQWNPSNEEQVEARIERMGQKSNSITAKYFIATGTIDEFFSELVEKKRGYMSKTLDGKELVWDQSSIISELAQVLAAQGSKKWTY